MIIVDRERRFYSGAQIDDLLIEANTSPGRNVSVKVAYGEGRPKVEKWTIRELFTHQIDNAACAYVLLRSGNDKPVAAARRKAIRAMKLAAARLAASLAIVDEEVPDHPLGELLRAELQAQQELWPEISKTFPGLLPTTFYDDGHSATDFPADQLLLRLARAAAVMARLAESAEQLVAAEMKQQRKARAGGDALRDLIAGLLQIWAETLNGQIAVPTQDAPAAPDGKLLRFLAKSLKPLGVEKSADVLRAAVRRVIDQAADDSFLSAYKSQRA